MDKTLSKTNQNQIVCIVGMCGSGKSIVADELVKAGFAFARFGQITLDIVKERGLAPTEENEKKIRESLRKEHGMGAFAILNLPKFDQLLEKSNLAADNLMSWSEYKILKEYYGKRLTILAILSPPELRYARLQARTKIDEKMRNRPLTVEQAKSRDYAEIENIEKGGPIAMANYYILNLSSTENLKKEVALFLEWLKVS
ncbi:MAG TPA: AAA family ATPase [Candidatus Nanoarchaeia archaeon]|nr:AAA family ATPase [Candidatus Nanoarchaeia archaeon]